MRSHLTGIVGWQKNSFIDFPKTVATVLFFSGCNLRCPYCHNPSVVNAAKSSQIDPSEVWQFLETRRKMIDGIVLSGGEPTLHTGLLYAVAPMRALGYKIKLDTNGLLPDAVVRIAPDYLSMDLKTSPSLYKAYCGAGYEDVRTRLVSTLEMVRAMGENAEVRITCAPGFMDDRIIDEMSHMLSGVTRVFLQPMQNQVPLLEPSFANHPLLHIDKIVHMRDRLASHVGACVVRGLAA